MSTFDQKWLILTDTSFIFSVIALLFLQKYASYDLKSPEFLIQKRIAE